MDRNHKLLRINLLKAGTLQASAGEQVFQTDVHSAGHDGLSLPALVDCPQDRPRKAGTLQASAGEQVFQTDVHSAGHDGLSLPALVDCPQDSPRKAGTLQASAGEQVFQTDVHSAGHDGLSLPALVDCPQDRPRKAGTLQASAGEQVFQTDVHSAGHDGLSLPALVDCPQDSPRKNLVPKPPQGPRPSRETNIAKAEKKAREAIKARRAREAKAGVKKLSRQVVGVLALPQTLLSRTTSYSVLPAIKKGTKVTKMETTEPLCPLTPDGEIMMTTTHAARAAPSQTLEEEVGGAEVSEMSDSSLMPTKNRQDSLEKIPSLLPGKEDILLRSTPCATVMSPQTLKFILHGIMCRLEASESPQTRRANDPFRLMKDLFVEVQHALKNADISVVFGLEESIQFSGEDAVKAIVKTAAKRLSLRSDSNRAQLRAARSGSEGAIGCMADTITQVIDDYSENWSSDGHFGARRRRASGRSHSSTSSRSDVTLTEELLAWRETLEEDLEEMADDSTGLEKTSVSSAISEKSQVISYLSESTKPISSVLSTDLKDITSTQKKEKEEAMKKEVRKSGKKKRGNNKDQKKNKVSPLGNDSIVAADEPKKKQALLPRITATLAKLFCFPCKKKLQKVTVQKTSLGKPCCHLPQPIF
ncbi:uncharacterized protein [Salvelinus alpinus]|uniref:uncharacterized protein n=1 Tax=Salvelinus alpinus TaxID=8036 RepID=UPI0039FB99CE